jgi:hypothetical protein
MPVYRFRDFEDARRALWISADDPSLARRIRRLWQFSARLCDRRIPRGVRRFRTIEEANADRERWLERRIRRLENMRER